MVVVQQTLACVCLGASLMERVGKADFVATAKILNVKPDQENSRMHNITIEIIDLFKGGHTALLKLYSDFCSSCAFYTPENTTWLIFANKNKDGNLTFGFCSGAKQMDKKFASERYPNAEKRYKKTIERKLEVLKYLKKEKITPINEFGLKVFFPTKCLENFRGFEVKEQPFALYELTIDKDLSIKKVKPIKEFDNDNLKSSLRACLKEAYIWHRSKKTEIEKRAKILITLYYSAANEKRDSFISKFDV